MKPSVVSSAGRKPLAAAVAITFALASPAALAANTWYVTSCADSGSGSLRSIIVNNAASGDTVDFTQLNSSNCPSSTISLITGAITIGEALTLAGRPATASTPRITITGYYNGKYQNDRLINHTMGGSQLNISNLNFWYSKFSPASGNAKGACIYSAGSVSLTNVQVFHCQATASGTGNFAIGGGVYAHGNLSMKYSRITGNSVAANAGAFAPAAGGVYSGGAFSASYSTIDGNSAPNGNAGGVMVNANASVTIAGSTISGNTAGFAGGIDITNASSVLITNSTISGNSSNGSIGGLASSAPSTTILNSTIAFNTAAYATPDQGPGVYLFNGAGATAFTVNMQSSILSNNTYGTTENDFGAHANGGGTFNITSNNNIVRAAPGTFRPATVTTDCPLLGSLRDNGGPTLTHALLSHSPAIDSGNNNASRNEDQRGRPFDPTPYPYPRQSGIAPDIGAYEVQQDDVIFNTSFEDCPAVF
jgi:hypothetical protein